ncbi:uncharacterized protein LOC117792315 [Drosophila innubila]|uniref:uncharacterized protein LOC117792315 n=1 Tax=Drosophila innubila TaxID=198719 RepID=UPI00148B462B|nr:uncharacterized protein LOC117792315 [Drosophila innubila]
MEIFENICRTCGNDCLDAINIFVDSVVVLDKNVPISEVLAGCLPACGSLPPLQRGDDYPQQICRVCIKKLIMIYEFNNKWLTANNEFGVALKFEQRRNRSRVSQPTTEQNSIKFTVKTLDANDQVIETDDDDIKATNIVFKNEPNEFVEMEMISEKELSTKTNLGVASTSINYQCALCEEQYHTLAAYQKHHKFSHRNCQFIYYTPGQ